MPLLSPRSREPAAGRPARGDGAGLRRLAEQVFTRAAGAPLIGGNSVRILRDARENFPAWLQAIAGARRSVLFENYIIADDDTGRMFVAALAEKARSGVAVCVIHDWMGGLAMGSTRVLAPLIAAGGQVRCFNPPQLDSPFGWLTRDHRKMIAVDGMTGFVSGLCVSSKWIGDPQTGCEPWRDTGIEIRGPAVADIELAFAQTWAAAGTDDGLPEAVEAPPAGDVALRVLASQPSIAGIYRLDQMIAAMARSTLWLTDAYFVGFSPYVQALRAAAHDGVDVRLLVPGTSDVPALSRLSRAGYRPLLEAGVRVFEWNGAMLHAKTAVADGRWARVGSTNLNLASWIVNYELDVALEDEGCARNLQAMYEEDLDHATEIVLGERQRVSSSREVSRVAGSGGRAARAAAGALRIGNTVGAALTNRRMLGPAEAGLMFAVALFFAVLALLALVVPLAVTLPLAALAVWIAVTLLVRGWRMHAGRSGDDARDQRTD
ncbi:MAG: phospholipase D-like domain-containing protein [Burkholderiales bacterium]